MTEISNASKDLFFKLRNRFPKINMGDEDGNTTVDPEQARFFNFTYTDKESLRPYGHIMCSIVDNNSMKVFFDTDITERMLPEDKPYWYKFLRELRRMAKSHMLNFDVRDITKDTLSRQDLQYMIKLNPEKKKIKNESIMEGRVDWRRRGKISEGNVNNVTIHVVHSEKMLENTNNRLLKVDRIYCVNESGEKFLLPFKSVSGAKAMANYIGRGGNPYDTNGQIISRAVNEMRNLSRFTTATRTKTFESEQAGHVIRAAQKMKESIRGNLLRMSNNSRNFTDCLESLVQLLPESDDDITEVKGWFTTQAYNENLDNYIGSAAGAYKRLKESAMLNLSEASGAVEQKIMNPNWQLVLKADPAMDSLMISRRYTDNKALLSAVLGDVANRTIAADGDDVANFAALMGDLVSSEGEAFGQRPNDEYNRDKKLAIMLAQKYMRDLAEIKRNPGYAEQVRQNPEGRKLMAKKSRSPADEFEEQIMGMGQEPVNEATCNMTEAGEMCAVHGMDECWSGSGMAETQETYTEAETEQYQESTQAYEPWTHQQVSEHLDNMIYSIRNIIQENYIYADEEDDGMEMSTDDDQAAPHSHDEYDGEAGMAKTQLHTIARAAQELDALLASDENLPEWIQAKITKAADYLAMATDTMASRHEQGQVHHMATEDDMEEDMLKGKQKQLDKNHNDKIDGQDFAIMRGDKKTDEAINSLRSLAGIKEAKKPDADGDGVPDWADKNPGEDDKEEKPEKHVDEAKSKKADKDYDGDGEVESEKDEVWGSRMAAAKKSGKMDESLRQLMRLSGQLEYVTEDPVQMNPITGKQDSFTNDDSNDQFANAPDPTRDNMKNSDLFNQMRPGDQAGARMVYDREHGLNPPGGAAVGDDEIDAMYAKEYAAKQGAGMGHLIDPKNPYLIPGYTGPKDSFGKSKADWAKEAEERRNVIATQGMDAFNAKYGLLPGSPRYSQVTPQNQELETIIGQHNMLKAAGMPSPYSDPANVKAALDAKKPDPNRVYKDSWYNPPTQTN
jgi:hypothetical protein